MRFRRLAAMALAAAAAVIPATGHAIGEKEVTVDGTDCIVGRETLAFNGAVGQWEGSAAVVCATAKPVAGLTFTVSQVQGVDTTQHPYVKGTGFSSYDAANNTSFFGCTNCTGALATGQRQTLVNGLYVMKTSALVQQPSGALARGYHTACFLIRGTAEGMVTPVDGCIP